MGSNSLQDVHDRAALYALGVLGHAEARDFEAHLSECEACKAEVRDFSSVTADLAITVAASPSSSVRMRVLERIAGDRLADGRLTIDGGMFQFVRTAGIPWEQGAIAGVQIKRLFRDADRGYSAKLVRLAPGTLFPPHRHADVEELFLLEGDALIAGVLMRAGDYCRAEPGSVHTDISTSSGVLFICMSSDRDEFLT